MSYLYQKTMRWFFGLICASAICCGVYSCTKIIPVDPLVKPDNSADTANDMRKALNNIPDCSLFAQAFQRAAVASLLDPGAYYTVFAPTDSAMKVAGLTADVINSMPLDSLNKIVKYHITHGAVNDTTLRNATISTQQNCLLDSNFFDLSFGYRQYVHSLSVKIYGSRLSINGWFVNNGGVPAKASNGYIHRINIVLRPPTQRVLDIIQSRPELRYYAEAIRMMDSVYYTHGFYSGSLIFTDSTVFKQVKFEGYLGDPSYNTAPKSVRPTVFAPTNTAFINAGFPDIASIRAAITGSIRTNVPNLPPYAYLLYNIPSASSPRYYPATGAISYTPFYLPLDSILKLHYLFNADQSGGTGIAGISFANILGYSDLTNCTSINNGIFNICTLNTTSISSTATATPYNLQFAAVNGALSIQWNSNGTNNALIDIDENQMTGHRNFLGVEWCDL